MHKSSRFSPIKIASHVLLPLAAVYEKFIEEKPICDQYRQLHTALHKELHYFPVLRHFELEHGPEFARIFNERVTLPLISLSAFWLSKPKPDEDSDKWAEDAQNNYLLVMHAAKQAVRYLRDLALVMGAPGHPIPKNKGRGKPPNPEIKERVATLIRAGITKQSDLRNQQKLRNAFGALEKDKKIIPGFDTTDWMDLLNNSERSEELKKVKEALRQNLNRYHKT
jgi:hypothetical protein